MNETKNIEQKLYELLKPGFINTCPGDLDEQIMTCKVQLSESQEAACHLFDRTRIFYKVYATNDINKSLFVVSASFESTVIPLLRSCFSNAGEAKALFDNLKKNYCETS